MIEKTPETPSSDYEAMAPYWTLVNTILGGAAAMRRAGKRYLPKFPHETEEDYAHRLSFAKFTNIYRDIVENLAARPFGQEVTLIEDGASDRMRELAEDIDGQGNHLHVFAGATFFAGINAGIDWILVDFTKNVPANASQAQEREMGARPYWVSIPADRMLAAYSAMIGGKEEFVHARILEPQLERDGYGEKSVKRVRILNRELIIEEGGSIIGATGATYEVHEEQELSGVKTWVLIEGPNPISVGIIPLVPFITGRRKGSSWQVVPPMQDAAYLQVEHYQQESGLKYAREMTAFPMLAGNGVAPAMGDDGKPVMVPVGPKTVLYAPPNGEGEHGDWSFIEPSATALKFLSDEIKETAKELRELGRQPLTAQSGNLTVVTTAYAAQKGNTAIQAWALNLKDALERALLLTAKWLKSDEQPQVSIDTDFDLGLGDDDGFGHVLTMRERGDLSQETTWAEARRRNILSPEFEGDDETERLDNELPGEPEEQDLIDAA